MTGGCCSTAAIGRDVIKRRECELTIHKQLGLPRRLRIGRIPASKQVKYNTTNFPAYSSALCLSASRASTCAYPPPAAENTLRWQGKGGCPLLEVLPEPCEVVIDRRPLLFSLKRLYESQAEPSKLQRASIQQRLGQRKERGERHAPWCACTRTAWLRQMRIYRLTSGPSSQPSSPASARARGRRASSRCLIGLR